MVFRGQSNFIDQGPDAYLEWGRHFGRCVALVSSVVIYISRLKPNHIDCRVDCTFTPLQAIQIITHTSISYTSQFPCNYPNIFEPFAASQRRQLDF